MNKCLACEREFEELKDFPLVEIIEFKRLKIPEIIMSENTNHIAGKKLVRHFIFWKKWVDNKKIPKDVLESFRKDRKDIVVYGGLVYKKLDLPEGYYEVGHDLTSIVKEALTTSYIKDSLSALENYVGKEVRTKDLLNLPGFKKMKGGNYNDLTLSFFDERKKEDDVRICNVNLEGGWGRGCLSIVSISQDLAELHYIGKINK